ncbi:lipopolysaccharide biosynthesis protein [Sphingomonas sp. NFR15]|uniref:lipopolysaccharide biosynthesis protein n=1 Tax=Sphingomonas sp. NFR15 TaxID=1566282 RepID=UPI0008805D0E|nr:lipopolysaccharide biosynthesis protein [Sphingomonas sp. NFR15]SDA32276.1 Polysaccharide biosynthesis protein [Sphingomonas sp. NFR15]
MSGARGSVRWTATGNILRAVLATVQLLIVARLLGVADFGLVVLMMSLLQLAQSLCDAGLSSALIRFRDVSADETSSLYWLNVMVGLGVALATIAAAPLLAHLYAAPRLTPMLWIASGMFVANGFYLQLRVLAERDLRFEAVIKVEVAAAAVGFLVAVGLALARAGPYCVVWGQLATSASALGLSWVWLARGWRPAWHFAWRDVCRFVPYGLDMLLVNLAISVTVQLDLLIAGFVFPKPVFGSFGQPRDLALKIMTAINPVILRVGLPLMAREQHDPRRVGTLYLRVLRMSASVCFPVYAALALFGADLLPLLLGERWRGAGRLLPYVAAWFALRATVNPLGTYLSALGRSRAALWYQLGFAALVASAAYAGAMAGPVALSLAMAAVYFLFMEIAWIAVLRPLSAVRFLDYHRQIVAPALPVLAALGLFSLARMALGNAALSLVPCVAAFLLLSRAFNRPGVEEITALLGRDRRMRPA